MFCIQSVFVKSFVLATMVSGHAFAVSNTRNCAVTFAKFTSKLNPNALESCLALIPKDSISVIQVVAFGGKEGTSQAVRQLSIQRATVVAQFVRKRFPSVKVVATGAGQDLRRGSVAKVSASLQTVKKLNLPAMEDLSQSRNLNTAAVTTVAPKSNAGKVIAGGVPKSSGLDLPDAPELLDTPVAAATATRPTLNRQVVLPAAKVTAANQSSGQNSGLVTNVSNIAPQNTDASLRAAVRGGADLWVDSNRSFPSLGIEFAWLPKASELNFNDSEVRLELGALSGVMTRDEFKNVYNVNAFGGGAYKLSDFAIGGRVLAGAAMSNETVVGEVGLEARGGYEVKGFSVFAGAGFTNRIARLGIDFGISY